MDAHLSLDAKGDNGWPIWRSETARRTTVAKLEQLRKAANRPQTGFDAPAAGDFGDYIEYED